MWHWPGPKWCSSIQNAFFLLLSVSLCIHPCMFHPSTHAPSCDKQHFIILSSKETLQPTDKIRTRLEELNHPAGINVLLYSHTALSPLSPPYFPLLPGGLSHSDCEYWFRLWRHDRKCQMQKLASLFLPAGVICLHSSLFALPSRGSAGLCTATSGLESTRVCLQSDNLVILLSFRRLLGWILSGL